MLNRINDYLEFKGLVGLDQREYEELVCHVRHNNKVDAIKALRTFSKCVDECYIKWPGLYDEYENDFYEFLLNHAKTFYEGPDSHSLGLKDAKGVVDIMFANLDAL